MKADLILKNIGKLVTMQGSSSFRVKEETKGRAGHPAAPRPAGTAPPARRRSCRCPRACAPAKGAGPAQATAHCRPPRSRR